MNTDMGKFVCHEDGQDIDSKRMYTTSMINHILYRAVVKMEISIQLAHNGVPKIMQWELTVQIHFMGPTGILLMGILEMAYTHGLNGGVDGHGALAPM
jgi:hypothetical protein